MNDSHLSLNDADALHSFLKGIEIIVVTHKRLSVLFKKYELYDLIEKTVIFNFIVRTCLLKYQN